MSEDVPCSPADPPPGPLIIWTMSRLDSSITQLWTVESLQWQGFGLLMNLELQSLNAIDLRLSRMRVAMQGWEICMEKKDG